MTIHEEETVLCRVAEGVATLTVNRPKVLNALNVDVLQSFALLLGKLRGDKNLRAVVLEGAGEKAFVAGADVAAMAELGPRPIADYIELGQRVMRLLEELPVPVVAYVDGFALGGGLELALACDLIVASSAGKFGQPEVKLGIIPGFGGTVRLFERAGPAVAKRLILTGEIIDAQEAYRLGVVDYLLDENSSLSLKDIVAPFQEGAPLAVAGAKKVLRGIQEQQRLAGLQHEVEEFLRLFSTVDREEGMAAFIEKRKAEFCGK